MSRPCPWCDVPLAETRDSQAGWVFSTSAQVHMWYCQFGLPASPVQAVAASVSAPSALPVSAPVDRSAAAGRGGLVLRRLLSALPGRTFSSIRVGMDEL